MKLLLETLVVTLSAVSFIVGKRQWHSKSQSKPMRCQFLPFGQIHDIKRGNGGMYVTSHSEEPDAVPFFAQASLRMTAITREVLWQILDNDSTFAPISY